MHLTTIISLLAAGAAAAPAARPLHLNSKVAQPTPSKVDLHSPTGLAKAPEVTNLVRRQEDADDETAGDSSSSSSSSAAGLIPGLPSLPIRRRQDPEPTEEPSFRTATAEEDSKDASEAEETPLDAYLNTFDGEGEYDEEASEKALDRYHESLDKDENNSTTSTITTSTSVAPAAKTVVPVEAKNETSIEHSEKNVTSSAAPVTNSTEEIDSEKLASKTEAPKNETLTEDATKKNETEPEPTKKADPLKRLSDLLTVKRAELPDLPEIPSVDSVSSPIKRQVEEVTEAVPKVDEEDVAATDAEKEEITTPTVDKNATAAVNETEADSDGYYGISKHMAKLDKLPIGGLPIKRQASELPSTPIDEVADSEPTSGLPTESQTSPLYKYLVPLQHQNEELTSDVTAPSESSDEELAAVPAVESQQKTEKRATSSKTTEEVSSDTEDVADSTVPDTGLNGLLGGLA